MSHTRMRRRGCRLAALALCSSSALAQTEPVAAPAAPDGSALEQVVITSRRAPPASKTTLSGEELRRVPGTAGDPMKALQSLPGVVTPDDASSEPAIRGSRPQDNAYYVDFLPVGYLFHVGGLVSVLHADLVNKFELYSAAFGPEYADVLGGVLDVTLRNPRTDRLGGKFNVSLLGADVLLEGPLADNQSFYFAARRSYLDLVMRGDLKDDDTGVITSVPQYHDYQGKYLWSINEDHRLALHLTGAADQLRFSVPEGSLYAVQDPLLAGNSRSDTSYGTQALVWDARLDRAADHKLALGHTVNRQQNKVGSAIDVGTTSHTYFLREQLRLRPLAGHELTLGGTLRQVHVDVDVDVNDPRCTEFDPNCDFTNSPRQQVSDRIRSYLNDFHLQDRWQLAPAWALSAGLHHSRDGYLQRNHTEPRLGLEWKWSAHTLLTAGWGRHHQMPAGEQILKGIGNPALWHVRATHSVLGLTQKLDAGWSWRIEAYQKRFSDFVVADPAVNYLNGASGQARGLELLLKKEPTSALSGWLSLSYSKARRRNDVTGEEFPFEFDQPLIATLVGHYKASERWQFGAKWSYHTGAPDTPIIGTGSYPDGRIRPIYGALNSERLPSYHRLDLRADRSFSPTLKGYAELINAYGRQNVSGYNYTADYSARKPVTQLPTLISFGVEVGF